MKKKRRIESKLNFRGLPIAPHCTLGHRLTWMEGERRWECFTCPRLAKTKPRPPRRKPNPVTITWREPRPTSEAEEK